MGLASTDPCSATSTRPSLSNINGNHLGVDAQPVSVLDRASDAEKGTDGTVSAKGRKTPKQRCDEGLASRASTPPRIVLCDYDSPIPAHSGDGKEIEMIIDFFPRDHWILTLVVIY